MAINPEAIKALQSKLLQARGSARPMASPQMQQGALPEQAAAPADANRAALMQKLQGIRDSRGPVGEMARGKNMYPGGNAAQQGGGMQFGRPAKTMMAAAKRRMGKGQMNG